MQDSWCVISAVTLANKRYHDAIVNMPIDSYKEQKVIRSSRELPGPVFAAEVVLQLHQTWAWTQPCTFFPYTVEGNLANKVQCAICWSLTQLGCLE